MRLIRGGVFDEPRETQAVTHLRPKTAPISVTLWSVSKKSNIISKLVDEIITIHSFTAQP